MEDAHPYRPVHYVSHNREEMGAAVSSHICDAAEFAKMLDSYDSKKWVRFELELANVPLPVEMTRKLKARKKGKTTQEETEVTPGQRECADFLNGLIKRLPST